MAGLPGPSQATSAAAGSISSPIKAYNTPTKRVALANAEAGPSRRPQGASPAYSSRRHSLYGIEDRIIIDPGSRIWKVGYSGEYDPRGVFWAQDDSDRQQDRGEMWDLDLDRLEGCGGDRKEAGRLVGVRIVRRMRETFARHLLTDAKSRKVIVLENTYLPTYVKELIAQALFDNLKVPSVSFTPSSLLSLTACGRVTGLVVDCGWLETTVTPVYYARPLHHTAHSTPLAGRALHCRLKRLLRHHGRYYAPPISLSDVKRTALSPVPTDVLTDYLVEEVITRSCFASDMMTRTFPEDIAMTAQDDEAAFCETLRTAYEPTSTASDLTFPVSLSPPAKLSETGPGTLVVPGWIRERVAEVLFEDEDAAEAGSIATIILACLLKLPVDLRSTMASSILVTGGTASLRGFIPRLRIELKSRLLPPAQALTESQRLVASAPLHTPLGRKQEVSVWRRRSDEPYHEIYSLLDRIAILNDPAPLDGDGSAGTNVGSAPRWTPSLMSWVGGSLAGALKSGSPEMLREEYDTQLSESVARGEHYQNDLDEMQAEVAALVGVDLETLRPGEALGRLGRRRGWKDGVGIKDWSRPLRTT